MDIVPTRPDAGLRDWHYSVPDDDYTLFEFDGWDGEDRVKLTATFDVGDELKSFPTSVERVDGSWRLNLPKEHARAARP